MFKTFVVQLRLFLNLVKPQRNIEYMYSYLNRIYSQCHLDDIRGHFLSFLAFRVNSCCCFRLLWYCLLKCNRNKSKITKLHIGRCPYQQFYRNPVWINHISLFTKILFSMIFSQRCFNTQVASSSFPSSFSTSPSILQESGYGNTILCYVSL